MKTVKRHLLLVLIPFLFPLVSMAANYEEGAEYIELANPQPTTSGDKIEVLELFWYGCPHCYKLEPYLAEWLVNKPEDVEFVRFPAIVGARWELLAKAYFTADLLGKLDTIHPALFAAIHEKHQKINDDAVLKDFFIEQGVSAEDFDNTFGSFAVAVKMNNAKMMTRRYAITGVPTVIVNGKFSTSGRNAGSNKAIVDVMRYLVEQERVSTNTTAAAE